MKDPLVSSDVDLRDFAFMPLDVLRLRDSDLAALASGEEFKAAVMLWCVAWHQVPAGSLPNDDRLLARHSGAGSAWKRVKAEALRGFVECSDGRLYHATIAEKAIEAWEAKLKQRERTRAATEAREAKRREEQARRDAERNVNRDDSRNEQRNVERESDRHVHQGTGTGTGTGILKDGAGAPVPTPDPIKSIFDRGVALIGGEGKSARAFMGKLRKQIDNDVVVMEAIARAEEIRPSDPIPWLLKACEAGKAKAVNGHAKDDWMADYVNRSEAGMEACK